jgi:hypothetical protein
VRILDEEGADQGPPCLRHLTGGRGQRPCRASNRPRRRAGALQPKRNPIRIVRGTELRTGEQVSWTTGMPGPPDGQEARAT